jgi:hypothetical protein
MLPNDSATPVQALCDHMCWLWVCALLCAFDVHGRNHGEMVYITFVDHRMAVRQDCSIVAPDLL